MAKKISNLAEVKVYINGKEQAKRDLDDLKKKAEEFKEKLDATKQSISDNTSKMKEARERANASTEGSAEHTKAVQDMLDAQTAIDKGKKQQAELEKGQKQINRLIRETEKFAKDIAEDLENLSGQRINRLNEMKRQIEAIRNSLNPEEDMDGSYLAFLNDAFNRIVETIKNKKGELIEFSDIMDDLTNIDDTSLAKAEQRLRSLLAATDKDDVERIKQLKDELRQVTGERQRRVKVEALDVQQQVKSGTWKGTIEDTQKAIELQKQYQKQLDSTDAKGIKEVEETIDGLNKKMVQGQKDNAMDVLTKNLGDSSTLQIKQSVDILTQYRETLKPLSSEWKKVNAAIEEGKEKLKSLVDQTKLQAMTAQYKNLGDLSKSALSDQKKYWQEMVDGAAAGSKELATYESRLKKVTAEEQKRTKEQAGKVMNNLSNYSVNEIKEAIKATEQLRDAQKPGSKAWAEYAAQVKNAGDYLDSFKNKAQLEAMNTQFKDLGKLSADALAEQKRYWQSMISGAANGSKELEQYRKKLAEVTAEEQKRNAASVKNVMANPAKYSVNEVKEAIKVTEQLRDAQVPGSKAWKDYTAQVTNANAVLDKFKDNAKLEAMTDQYKNLGELSKSALSEQKKYWQEMVGGAAAGSKELATYESRLKKVTAEEQKRTKEQAGKVMNSLSNYSVNEIKEAIKATEQLRDAQKPGSKAWAEYADQVKNAGDYLDSFKNKAQLDTMNTQFKDLGKLSADALAEQKRYWQSMISGAANGSKELEQYRKKLAEVTAEEQKRNAASVKNVMANPAKYSVNEVKEAIKVTEQLRDAQVPGSKAWKDYAAQVTNANAVLDKFKDNAKLEAMTAQYKNLGELSKSALSAQKKYWQEMVDGAAAGSKELATYESLLKEVTAEEQKRTKEQAGKVMNNLSNYSVNEIKEAIKATEQLRDAQKPGSKAWAEYADQVKNAGDYLDSFKDKAQLKAMNAQFKDLGKLSADAIAEQKKYWQSMVSGAANGSKELEQYRKKLAEVTTEEQKRNAASVKNVMDNPAKYSVNEIKEAIKVTEQLRDAQVPGSKAWKDYAAQVTNANAVLDKFKDNAKLESMTTQFRNLNTLSKSALSEQKKFWQAMADGAAAGSKELELYERRLKLVLNQERLRTREQGRELAKSVLSGSWTGTVGEAKEAVKVLKDYKDTLSTTDTAGLKRVDKAIAELTNKTKIAEAGFKSTNEALKTLSRQTKNLGQGNWKGSISELEEMRRKLIAIRDTQDKVLNPEERNKLEKSLSNVNKELAILKGEAVDVQYILANMKDTPLWKLEKAAKQLQEEIRECSENTGDFAKKAAELRQVNAQVEKLKKQFKDTDNVILRTIKRLAAYVAVYGGFNYVKDRIQEVVQANLQLSDSIADVEKTTGLSAEKLALLGEEIRAIDTRTTQEQLYQLAAAAGQLGLKSETDIAGFVRAANMITVSLNELGTEATTQLMKIATLTGEVQDGTEKALLSIGSAINELTANSAAAAGPIVDLMNRMGGVAAQSRLTSAEMAAIGATADALGQSMEITGTSMNKFLTTLMSDTDQIAYALNMDAKALRSLVNEGKTMDAVISIFERMNDMGGLGELAGVMGDLGSEGARMTQVLAAMASRVDFLKGQVELSTEAYNKATSIQDEYNVKNENAIAILQRMGNAVKEVFVNNVVVDGITAILRAVYQFGVEMKGMSATAQATATAIGALTAALIANRVAWIQNAQARTAAFWSLNLQDKLTWLKLVMLDYTKAIWANIKALGSWTASLFTTRKAIDAVSTAWKGFTKFLSTNWITITIAALGALAAWLIKVKTYVSETAKATARYNRELQEETDKVDTLFNSLKRLNSTEADRAKTINTINQQYSQYLGFMLDEKDSAEKLAAAHQLINAELRKRMALNLRTTLEGTASNAYAEQLEKSSSGIGKAVENLKVKVNGEDQKERSVTTNEVMRLVSGIINKRVAEDTSISREQLMEEIKSAMTEAYRRTEVSNTGKKYTVEVGADLYEDIEGQIGDLIDSRVEFQKKVMLAEDQANVEMEQLTEDAIEARKNANAQIAKEIEDAKSMSAKLEQDLKSAEAEAKKYEKSDESEAAKTARTNYEQAEKALKDHYTKMVDNANDYVESTRKLMEDYNADLTKDDKERMNEEIELYKSFANETAKLVPGIDPWGKGRDVKDWKEFKEIVTNLDTSSATALAAAYKAIKEDTALIPDNVEDFYKMYDTAIDKDLKLQTPENVAKQIHSWAEQIKNKLKTKFGRNTTLGFIFEEEGGDGASEAEKEARKQYNAVMAALEAHFLKRKQVIQDNYLAEKITGEEMNRQIADNEEAHLRARVELRKKLLGQANTFEQEQYEELAGKNIEQTGEFLRGMGDVVTDGIAKNLEQDEVKVREGMIKIRQAIEEEMLKYDIFGKFENDFAETMDKLQLLTTQLEKDTAAALQEFGDQIGVKMSISDGSSEEDIKKKIKELMLLAEKSYTVNAEGLKEMALGQTEYYTWWGGLNEKQLNDMLVKLRDYYDNVTLLREQYQKRMEREFEGMYKQTGQQKIYEDEKQRLGNIGNSQEQLEDFGVRSDYGAKKTSIGGTFANEYKKLEDKKKFYEQAIKDENDKIDELEERLATLQEGTQEYLNTEKEIEAIKGGNEYIAMTTLITNTELEQNELLAQSQRDLTQVYMDEWTKRAERWGQWGEMFGEYLGEQVMLEKQANDARARGDLETAKKIEQQQKQNKQALIQNLLSKIVDEAALWAKEYALKMMFNSLMLAEDKKKAIEEMSLEGKKSTLSIFLSALTGQASEHKKGLSGLVTGAIIFAATMALQALAKSAIANMFPEAASGSTANRKLSTGMLTYAEGNYPVLGNDGKVYDAKYEGGGMKTGIYGGGAHFGIFSEKQPEMIVDGKTTQKLILNYPYIYDAITTIAKNGRLVNAMPTFASGDYPAGMNRIAQVEAVDISGGSNEDMIQMRATMEETREVNRQLLKLLQGGITAHLDGLETHRQQKKNERFLKRRGID